MHHVQAIIAMWRDVNTLRAKLQLCFSIGRLGLVYTYVQHVWGIKGHVTVEAGNIVGTSNESEGKLRYCFFFDIEANWTPSIVSKLYISEHIRCNKSYFQSEANTYNKKKTIFFAKLAHYFRSKANTLYREKNYFWSKANTLDRAKRTHSIIRKLFSKRSEHFWQ